MGEGQGSNPAPMERSQVAIGLFRNNGTDIPREAIGQMTNCFSKEVSKALCVIR